MNSCIRIGMRRKTKVGSVFPHKMGPVELEYWVVIQEFEGVEKARGNDCFSFAFFTPCNSRKATLK